MRINPDGLAFTLLLGLLAALPALSIDISAPTLVILPAALGTSATVAGLTLSVFMVGFAAGQLTGGYTSDRYGRRPVLLISLAGYIAAGLGCTMSFSGAALVVFRLFQGVGAGSCSVLAFAIIQDLFESERARRKRSYVTAVFGTVPILAPALGTWTSGLAGWRAVHGILVLAGLALLAVVLLGAVGQSGRPKPATLDQTSVAVRLRNDQRFIGLALVNALSYGSIFAYIAGLPVVMIGSMGYTPAAYAAVFASTAAALTLGAWTNGRIVPKYVDATRALNASLVTAALASLALVFCYVARFDAGVTLIPPLLIALFCRGVIAPNIQHSAIERRRNQAGIASAAIGVSQILMGALTSAVVAFLIPRLNVLAVAAPMSALTTSAVAVWWWLNRQEVAVGIGR